MEINRVDHSVSSRDLYRPSEWRLFISRCEVLKSRSSGPHWRGLEAAGWVQHIKRDYVQAQVSITFLQHHYLCMLRDWLLARLMNALWGEITFIPNDFYHLITDSFFFFFFHLFIYTDLMWGLCFRRNMWLPEVGDPYLRSLITQLYNSKQVLVRNTAKVQLGLIYQRQCRGEKCFVLSCQHFLEFQTEFICDKQLLLASMQLYKVTKR